MPHLLLHRYPKVWTPWDQMQIRAVALQRAAVEHFKLNISCLVPSQSYPIYPNLFSRAMGDRVC